MFFNPLEPQCPSLCVLIPSNLSPKRVSGCKGVKPIRYHISPPPPLYERHCISGGTGTRGHMPKQPTLALHITSPLSPHRLGISLPPPTGEHHVTTAGAVFLAPRTSFWVLCMPTRSRLVQGCLLLRGRLRLSVAMEAAYCLCCACSDATLKRRVLTTVVRAYDAS